MQSIKSLQLFIILIALLAIPSAALDRQDDAPWDYPSLKIYLDVDKADKTFGANDNANRPKYIFMRKCIVSLAGYFYRLLSVRKGFNYNVEWKEFVTPLAKIVVPGGKKDGYHIYVYVDVFDSTTINQNFMTHGQYSEQDKDTGRPIAGTLSINLYKASVSILNRYHYFGYIAFDFFKLIAFDKKLFTSYRDRYDLSKPIGIDKVITTGDLEGTTREFLVLDTDVRCDGCKGFKTLTVDYYKAQDSNPIGILLEDLADPDDYYKGNSLEAAQFQYDFLGMSEDIPLVLTESSLSLAASTGWYNFDYCKFQQAKAPQVVVKDFQKKICSDVTNDMGCSNVGDTGCSFDGTFKTLCKNTAYSNSCNIKVGTDYCHLPYDRPNAKSYEYFGPNARCIVGATDGPVCLKVTSFKKNSTATANDGAISFEDKNGRKFEFVGQGTSITVDGQVFSAPGGTNTNNYIQRYVLRCPNDCSGNGICMSSTNIQSESLVNCFCFYGYTGKGCEFEDPTFKDLGEPVKFYDLYETLRNAAAMADSSSFLKRLSVILTIFLLISLN